MSKTRYKTNTPEDWKKVKIGDISKVVRGSSPRPKGDPRYYGGPIPRLMGEDITRDGKYVTPKIDSLTEEGAKQGRVMEKGTLVMVCSGNVGVPAILSVKSSVHDGFLAFPKVNSNTSIEFLYYIFNSLLSKFNSSATHGGVFTNLTTNIIKEFELSLPPLPEQQTIASILSTVDEKIETIEGQIKETEHLKKGLMQRLLTKGIGHTKFQSSPLGEIPESWEVVNLGDLFKLKSGESLPKSKVIDGDYPVYGGNGIIYYHTEYNIEKPTIIIGRVGAKCGCINFSKKKSWITDNALIIYKKIRDYNTSYMFYLLDFLYLNNYANKNAQPVISGQKIYPIKIGFPSIKEQQKIASILSTVDEKLENLQSKKAQYEQLKKGLMQQLLTGKIRVKVKENNA